MCLVFGSPQIRRQSLRGCKPSNDAEFAQNDLLLQTNRIHAYGPARYGSESNTSMWLRLHTPKIATELWPIGN